MINDMPKNIVELFRSVITEYDAVFVNLIQHLNIGMELESIRWISKTPEIDYADVEKLKRLSYGKVSKSSPIYENDTGHKYIIEINEEIFNSMSSGEQKAFVFYLLSYINIYYSRRDGEAKFSLVSQYAASKILEGHLGEQGRLPSPEQLAARF